MRKKFTFFIEKNNGKKIFFTESQHKKYKKLIKKILSKIYGLSINIDGYLYVKPQKFDSKDAYVSIINKAIGNISLIKHIINKFNINSNNELIKFVRKNKYKLFKSNNSYFDDILQVLKNSEQKGIQNEIKAQSYITEYLDSKNIDFDIRQTDICSYLDVIEGVDLIINIKNSDWYVQVKPLVSYQKKDSYYEIISKGKIKKYNNIHYYIFVNDNECLLFSNKGLIVENYIIYVPEINLKN